MLLYRENLATDRYLKSQMDSDHYVSLKVLVTFPKVMSLKATEQDIVEAVQS